MPAPADVQITDGGGSVGVAETDDVVTFTFAGVVDPALILTGWNGSAVAVTVRIQGQGQNDALDVRNGANTADLTVLGQVDLNGKHANGQSLEFTGSQMTLVGNSTVRIVLGPTSGHAHHNNSAKAMVWTTPQGTATESGPLDADF
jgi:chitinase